MLCLSARAKLFFAPAPRFRKTRGASFRRRRVPADEAGVFPVTELMREFIKNTFPYFKKYLPVQMLATIFGLMRMVILLVTPQIVSLLVDRVINPALGASAQDNSSIFLFLIEDIPTQDYWRIFAVLAGTLVVFAVIFFVCFYLKWNIAHYFGLKSEKQMRTDALDKIGNASDMHLKQFPAGDLVLISTRDPRAITEAYTSTSQYLLDNVFYIVVCAVLLARIQPYLLILPLLGGVAAAAIMVAFKKPISRMFDMVWKDTAALSTTVQESVYGVRTVASFARERERIALFERRNQKLLATYQGGAVLFAKRQMISWGTRIFIILGEVALAVWLGVNGFITGGEFTATVGYLGTLMWQFTSLFFIINDAQEAVVSARRYFGFLHAEDEQAAHYKNAVPSRMPDIELKGVCVKNGETYALKDIDLSLPYGKKLGVMGRTGAGKTLLVRLMQGLAEADEGEIIIDGRPVHDFDRDALLRTYSYAMQNVFLFSNTIAQNIALYDPFAAEERIRRAGALAEVDEFALRFPDGYDTTIGEKGFGLSGGQKQRISIARAIFKDADVLIFDDVTSALDLDTERSVLDNIASACGRRTTVFVTHRATALKDCDEIIFLKDGQITERGTFDQLMALQGDFAEICTRQRAEVGA